MNVHQLLRVGLIKTLYVNFRCCRIGDAVRLPILVARNVNVEYCRSRVFVFADGARPAMFTVGFNRIHNRGNRSMLNIQGKVIVRGRGIHAFGAGCYVAVRRYAILDIGNNFGCTGDSRINVGRHITIGDNNLWSYDNVVMDTDGHSIYDAETNVRINEARAVSFGDNVWMGCGCTILKGSAIPSGSVVAARSIITKAVAGNNSIIGTQGKRIKENVVWKG